MKYLTVMLLALCSYFCRGQEISFGGQFIDSVFIEDTKESFSLYLPEFFDPKVASPMIMIFDPLARGKTGIRPFLLSSEAHGYILACSNNSKNGPYAPNYAIAERMYRKLEELYLVDKDRVYTAGFSGGARLASRIAFNSELINGVIACGAGLPENGEYELLTRRFPFAAVIGSRDMNYIELLELGEFMSKMSFPHDILTVDLDHRWPEDRSVLMAADWLQLEYFKSHPDKKADDMVEKIFQRALAYIVDQEERGHLIESAEGYNRVIVNFRRHKELDSLENRRTELLSSGEYRSEMRAFEASRQEERRLTEEYWNRFDQDMKRPAKDLKWWRKQMEKLTGKGARENRLYANMYERLKYKVFAHALETAQFRTLPDAYAQKGFCYDLCMMIYPNYYYPYFLQMELTLEQEMKEKTIYYLERLIENGYDDKKRLLSSKIGRQLEGDPDFQALIQNM